jgi:UDP-GlcNAc3NAcA epimerase
MRRFLTVVGARPQFIKAAVVSRLLRDSAGVREVLVHTGQHFDANMSAVFFAELGLPEPDFNLEVSGGSHGEQTGRMLERLERVIAAEQPDTVIVYGDTNSTLAGALAAAKLHVPVAHVEAGLRSYNRRMPEEVNRVLTDHASDVLFAPTMAAVENLAREGIAPERVHLVGDVMYDAALHFGAGPGLDRAPGLLSTLGLRPGGYVLATVHRQENTDDPSRLHAILGALGALAARLPVVMPLHPRTRGALASHGSPGRIAADVRFIDPVSYLDMLALEGGARLIATDSGGVQKEAFFHRVPCVTLRGETEWVELVGAGWNRLASPSDPEALLETLHLALDAGVPATAPELYGGGRAGEAIVARLAGIDLREAVGV